MPNVILAKGYSKDEVRQSLGRKLVMRLNPGAEYKLDTYYTNFDGKTIGILLYKEVN